MHLKHLLSDDDGIELSDDHITNLYQLAHYLIHYPRNPIHFHMGHFRMTGRMLDMKTVVECDTTGCALGHGPDAGFPWQKGQSWEDGYSEKWFGLTSATDFWDWCFGGEWKRVDNTPHGAGKRILYMLRHGLPKDWEEQQQGMAPLCYTAEPIIAPRRPSP